MSGITIHRGPAAGAPSSADYLVKTADAGLSAERVVTDTTGNTGITWDWATGGQAKANATNAGKWIKLATATASSSSSVDFTGLSSSYIAYKVVLSHVAPATNTVQLWVRTSTNNGSSYDSAASDYAWTQGGWSGAGGTQFSDGDQADAQYNVTGTSANQGNASNRYVSGVFTIFNPSAAKYGQMQFLGNGVIAASGNYYNLLSHGVRLTAADIDAIRFMFSSGNIASGQFDLYGLAA